jgi:ferrochelatase
VVLLQLGGPDHLGAIKPFLYNLFCDPDIIDLPGAFLFRKPLASLISNLRAPKVQVLYRKIGGKSPILDQTLIQAKALQKFLTDHRSEVPVYIAMRYWHPFTGETMDQMVRDGFNQIILLPLYPHFSGSTTGSSLNEWKRLLRQKNLEKRIHYTLIKDYFDNPDYIESLVLRIKETLSRFPEGERDQVHLVFSAHGTPLSLVKKGDPYSIQIRATYEAVIKTGNFSQASSLCFQSKVGPQKWLEPSLTGTIESLAGKGVKNMLAIPIAFVSEHIETLSEINMEAREQAHELGVTHFEMMPALLDHPSFIRCLGELVLKELEKQNG